MKPADPVFLTRFVLEILVACVVLAFGSTVIFGALDLDIGWGDGGPQAGYVPFYVGCIMCAAALGILIQTVAGRQATRGVAFLTRAQLASVASFFLPIVVYVAASIYLGLYVSSAVYLAAVMIFQGGYGPLRSLIVGILTSGVFFVLFEFWFRIPLLKGPVEAALKIY